jgi:hypothetical protein
LSSGIDRPVSHPDRDVACWVDIKAKFADRKGSDRTVTVDKQRQAFDSPSAAELLRLLVPKGSGVFLAAPPKRERPTSNLLPITGMPEAIYLAPAATSSYPPPGSSWPVSGPGRAGWIWILRDGLVISFGDLSEPSLSVLCAGDVEEHETAEWATSTDVDTRYRFADLLART